MEVLTWQARSGHDLTLVRLAELSGISKSTLNNIENGKSVPLRLFNWKQLQKALNLKITDLFDSAYK